MLRKIYLTEARHAERLSFGNVFIIGQVSVQNHPKVLNRVRSGTSSLRIR